jgi:TP901 family phage tail tape measure protein
VAFVLDVNLRIQDILGLQKVEAALGKLTSSTQVGAVVGGAGATTSAIKTQAAAATAQATAVNKVTTATNKMNVAQNKAATSTRKATSGMQLSAKASENFGNAVYLAGRRYAAFVTATAAPLAIVAGLGKATASVIEFDSAILKLRQIMGQTDQQISSTRDTILDLAASTGTSASEIARVGKVLAQAGQRGDVLTESLTALSKVPLTPSFETIDAAIEGTIAALNQFNSEGLTTTRVLDVMTALSNKFAASSEDIAKGIARGGAAFEAIGGTFEEFASVFTTIRQATRESAETVGTFMKTISSRLADPKIVNFLEGKGIRISEAIEAGNPVEAIKRIAAALRETASIQDRIEIGTKLGGRRQISRLLALISNIDVLDETLKTAATSSGEFGKIAEEGLKGLQAQLNIMVQEWNKLIQSLAAPVFVPFIQMATQAGKALAYMADFAKPIIPALTYIAGFTAAFKLLAVSITNAGKALAFMGTVGRTVGGGLAATATAAQGLAAGGLAGTTARERVQRRLAGGVGLSAEQAAAAGAAGGRFAGGAKAAVTSQLGQLAVAAGIALAASKFSEAAEKAGSSAGIFASETAKAAAVIGIAISALSGKSITGALASLGPFGGAVAGVTLALGAMTYAANKAADIDMQKVIDEMVNKIKNIKTDDLEIKTPEQLQQQIGDLGTDAIEGIQEAANKWEDDWYDVFANIPNRLKNLFTGQGNLTINDAQAQEIIERIVGANPELLNKILQSAVEQFGAGGLETGIDQLLVEELGGNAEVIARVRQAMIKQLGGMEKIATNIEKIKLDTEVSRLGNAIAKASKDFETLHVPSQLSFELGMLSDAVGNTARAIETNVTLFDKLSQVIGQDIGVSKPGTEFSRAAVEELVRTGGIGDILDLSNFEGLDEFTTDMARVGDALDDFMKSIVKSKANADSLRSLLSDPKVDPFDIMSDYIDKFMDEYPDKIPPEAEAAFKAAATGLGQQLKNMITDSAGVLPSTEEIQKAMDSVLGKQRPFYDAAIDVYQTWLNAQMQQLNLKLSGEEISAQVDVSTAELSDTIITSLRNALKNVGIDLRLPLFEEGLQNANDVMVDLAQNGDLVGQVLLKYESSYRKHAELQRQIAEAQQTGEGASIGLLEASNKASIEVLNLQVVLSQLAKIAQRAPQALAAQQEEQRKLPYVFDEKAATKFTEQLGKSSEKMIELINRQRQLIEAQTAIDVAEVFKKPADIFAEALRESATAVRAFTSALTTQDLQRGLGVPSAGTTPEGRVYTARQYVPEARLPKKQVMDQKFLQSALFGGNVENVMEALLQGAATTAESKVFSQLLRGQQDEAASNKVLAESFREFKGFIYDIPKAIQESGLDPAEVAHAAAKVLREQATQSGAIEVEHIGAIQRTMGDLANSLKTLIERPEVAREPQQIIEQLPSNIQDLLRNLSQPTGRATEFETAPRTFEDISSSAADIQRAASETHMASEATIRSTEEMRTASTDIRTGGTDLLTASQGISEAIGQLQAFVDIQRETLTRQQEVAGESTDTGSNTEAIMATTEAINALGERVDSVAKAVEIQTQQAVELATTETMKPLEVEGLVENTKALDASSDANSKTREEMTTLSKGMSDIANSMKNGIGIDIETMSEVKVDVESIGAAAKEFTSEFEEVAHKVAKEEIRIMLQQLAREAGNSEAASTFESAIT